MSCVAVVVATAAAAAAVVANVTIFAVNLITNHENFVFMLFVWTLGGSSYG